MNGTTIDTNLLLKSDESVIECKPVKCTKEAHQKLIEAIKTRLQRIRDGQTTSID